MICLFKYTGFSTTVCQPFSYFVPAFEDVEKLLICLKRVCYLFLDTLFSPAGSFFAVGYWTPSHKDVRRMIEEHEHSFACLLQDAIGRFLYFLAIHSADDRDYFTVPKRSVKYKSTNWFRPYCFIYPSCRISGPA